MPVIRTYDAVSDDTSLFSSLTSTSDDNGSQRRTSTFRPLKRSSAIDAQKSRNKPSIAEPPRFVATENIAICGVKLRPTVVFNTFWRFAAERKLIDDRRRAGQQGSWTEDVILQKYHFCNTFRVLDRLSQYIIREVIEKGSQKPEELVFRIILFNLFTKIETWELLQKKLGTLTWATYNRDTYAGVLHEAKFRGMTIYTGAFQKPAPKFDDDAEGYVNHLILLEVFMDNELHKKLMHAWHMADIFEYLISFPSMGEFATYQLMLNLSYSKLLNFHRNDFVIPGPGASSGLRKMFGDGIETGASAVCNFEIEVIRWLADNQKYYFESLGLEPPVLGPQKLPMDVADIEHVLCELDKYARLAHSHIKGKRKELRRSFEPKSVLPARATLPRAWKHAARKTPRIRPDKVLVVEKRYSVSCIKAHRDGKDRREYLVYWWGYPVSEATWEPEAVLTDDAPAAVRDYWDRIERLNHATK